MPSDAIFKTIYQYNKAPISDEDMKKLAELAADYGKVKNYVYQRYGGIRSLKKLYPGYTVQNEMTESGLRAQLGLPSVYFYLAVFDALGDIKTNWSHTKNRILKAIRENPNLSSEDQRYLRFVMKMSLCFESILMEKEIVLTGQWKDNYDGLCALVDARRLDLYLCRQVRKHLKKMHTDKSEGFSISGRAYRYEEHGIYISTKEKRRRIFIPLTDGNQYKRQLYIRLYPEERNIKIHVPIEVKSVSHEEYVRETGLALGVFNMLVTDRGTVYGENYSDYQMALTNYVREGAACYRKNKRNNPGRKKYYAGKKRLEAALHTYINAELNRLLAEEKPKIIYIPKLPQASKAGINKMINSSISMWQRGYIRSRLMQKCREQSIELIEVSGKDISNECSACGRLGSKKAGIFICADCGQQLSDKENAAKNALKRGRAVNIIQVHSESICR